MHEFTMSWVSTFCAVVQIIMCGILSYHTLHLWFDAVFNRRDFMEPYDIFVTIPSIVALGLVPGLLGLGVLFYQYKYRKR